MANDVGNHFQIFQTLQEEALGLFDKAIQTTCQKLDEISEEAKVRMESLLRDLASVRKTVENQIAIIHEHSLKMINELVSETEKYIINIWDNTRRKILELVNTIVAAVDTDQISKKMEEFTDFMSTKVNEFNQRVKEHADIIVTAQKEFFDNITRRLQNESK